MTFAHFKRRIPPTTGLVNDLLSVELDEDGTIEIDEDGTIELREEAFGRAGLVEVITYGANATVLNYRVTIVEHEAFTAAATVITGHYFNSILYPFLVEDTTSYGVPIPTTSGYLIDENIDTTSYAVPTPQNGTLVASISFISYTNGLTEQTTYAVPVPQNGTLTVTISYLSYSNGVAEQTHYAVPVPRNGSLAVTITYVAYTNAATEHTHYAVPVPLNGTLV